AGGDPARMADLAGDLYKRKTQELFGPLGPTFSREGMTVSMPGELRVRLPNGETVPISRMSGDPAVKALLADHYQTAAEELAHAFQYGIGGKSPSGKMVPLTTEARDLAAWMKSPEGY